MTAISALAGARLYFDSNLFINALESPDQALRARLQHLFWVVSTQYCTAGCSLLTRAEVLVRPLRDNQVALADAYRKWLDVRGPLAVYPVDMPIVDRAARLRADYPALRLPDALHLAAAIHTACDGFVTADKRLAAVSAHIRVILLDQLTAD